MFLCAALAADSEGKLLEVYTVIVPDSKMGVF